MAECVSCGRKISEGKLFCDDCYVNMKGRRGALKGVPGAPEKGPASGPAGGGDPGGGESAYEAVEATETAQAKRASDALTPTSHKKVISMKPQIDGEARGGATRKRFTVTITFSERTYAALSRLKSRRAARASSEIEGHPGRKRSKTALGPYGRARLKAVKDISRDERGVKGGLAGILGYQDRELDARDRAAAVMSFISGAAILFLSFMPWVKLSWVGQEGSAEQAVEIRGVSLGAITYVCIAITLAALLYMVGTWLFKGPFTKLDYGVVFIIAGLVVISLLYASIASNARLLNIAMRQLARGTEFLPEQYERSTLWQAYAMVFMGALLAFSGLVRLSQRGKTSVA